MKNLTKKIAKLIIAIVCILYFAGWYHAETKCSTESNYIYSMDYKMMPPVYKQSFAQHAFKGGYCKLL